MQRHQIFAIVLALSLVNGLSSPYLIIVLGFAPIWMPDWLPPDPSIVFYLASLITATTTLLLSGVPAALVERSFPKVRQGNAVLYVWASAALLLTLPGILRLIAIFA